MVYVMRHIRMSSTMKMSTVPSSSPSCSQKDLENLKAEVQRRQQQQELGKIEEPPADGLLELEDKIPVD